MPSFYLCLPSLFSSCKPPPLPEELEDWIYLPLELFRKPWHHFAPFLASHGYIIAHTEQYNTDPRVESTPRKPPTDAFHPADDEDFLYRLFPFTHKKRVAEEGFFQHVSIELTFRTQLMFMSLIFSLSEINWIPSS